MVEKDSTARTRELGHRMKAFRQRRHFSGADVSRRNGWLQSKVTRWEQGLRELSVVDAALYLATCGEAEPERELLLELTQPGNDLYWVRPYFDELVDPMKSLMIQENLADSVVRYESLTLPELLQTEPYARTTYELIGNRGKAQLDQVVDARMNRRLLLQRDRPPKCRFYVHERALRSVIGSPRIMHEQVLHLVLSANLPYCSIRIVPETNEVSRTIENAFTIMEFSEHPAVVYSDSYAAGVFIDDRVAVEAYYSLIARLESDTLSEEKSRQLLAEWADRYDRMDE
ncbi:helix-turn-helix domain-containing protein [Amycolatopsis sp. lyj-112]|uniref:helix-turn-helix domain-containing protein n=1 Tax=Amycolatopsis sp. lyj-112 TaxID=2789288 RepID=UPI003978D3B2